MMRSIHYKQRIENEIGAYIAQMGEKNRLRDAIEYALTNGGKRLRPILVLMVAHAVNPKANVYPAALSVEFFHTASLIADDLPSMDNDNLRRGKPSLHRAFGEGVALLASYALIAAGYEGIYRNAKVMKSDRGDAVCALCLEAASRCAGLQGATNGQFLDLNPPDLRLETIQKIIYQKTVTLFEISLVFGWLFAGGETAELPTVRACAYHLGMAFQIADDLSDLHQQSSLNFAQVVGETVARETFEHEVQLLCVELQKLNLFDEFQSIVKWLKKLVPVNK